MELPLDHVAIAVPSITAALRGAVASCDAVVTSGGVCMGDVDLVKVVLDRLGDMRWMQVAVKPAKPLAFGTVARTGGGRVPVFGLPGNPVSSMVSFAPPRMLTLPVMTCGLAFALQTASPVTSPEWVVPPPVSRE